MSDEGRYPKAVLISDIHFTVSTLDLASSALIQAMEKADELDVPLVIAGDLNDTKALIRGEVANRLIEIFAKKEVYRPPYVLVGNHDLLNEKGSAHSLNFLAPYSNIVQSPVYADDIGAWLIPYQNDSEKLKYILAGCAKGDTLIMHQGVMGADMGHYIKDSTSLPREAFADFRVISGHYHKAQDIKCGRPRKGAVGLFSYIGSPYTISFSEAGDSPKGFRILWSDGILETVPTNLRKHIIVDTTIKDLMEPQFHTLGGRKAGDLLWIKLRGTQSELDKIKKKELAAHHGIDENFKLDKIPTESEAPKEEQKKELKDTELLDGIIDRTPESAAQKKTLKALWREILETT
jgi:DNA repair exonuclease SbcCD nuclease subunit